MSDGDVDGKTLRSASGSGTLDLAVCRNMDVSPRFDVQGGFEACMRQPQVATFEMQLSSSKIKIVFGVDSTTFA
jgi:hypothetical protein